MNLNDIHIFVTVAKQHSLTKAAKVLSIPKSTLSRRLSELEHSFGRQLLIRSKKQIELSNDGQELFDRSADLIEQLNWVHEDVTNQLGQLKGRLSIQIPIDFFALSALLRLFRLFVPLILNCRFRFVIIWVLIQPVSTALI